MMSSRAAATPSWTTASFGDAPDTSPMELLALEDHLSVCKQSHGRLFSMQCLGEAMHGFMAPRLVTTLVLVALVTGAASLLL